LKSYINISDLHEQTLLKMIFKYKKRQLQIINVVRINIKYLKMLFHKQLKFPRNLKIGDKN
jgi:hypothetical protein